MINRLLKRIIIRIVLGMLSWLMGHLSLPLLVILLCLAIIGAVSGTASAGPESGPGGSNANVTQQFTGNRNDAVVNAAKTLVQTLYACGDDMHYKCYTANFPRNVLQYLYEACGDPQCPYAQNGNFQCVFFVLGAYWLAGQPLPYGPNAVEFWMLYQNAPGWLEIPANGTPRPGDIAVFSGPLSGRYANPFGHVGIVIDAALPDGNGATGYIQLAQANGLAAVENLTLKRNGQNWRVTAWPGYNLLGYIRNAKNG